MSGKRKIKKIWLGVVALVLVTAAVVTAVVIPRLPKAEVYVYSFDMMGYINTYTGGSESYGMVTTDRVQSVFITNTQSVKEILVYQGQEVKKGDVLYRYDTTLSDLEVEKKELGIKQMEMNLSNAQAELKSLNSMKAMVIPKESTSSSGNKNNGVEDGKSPKDEDIDPGEIYNADTATGTSYKPYRVWLKKTTPVTEDMIWEYLEARHGEKESWKEGKNYKVYVIFGVVSSRDKKYETEYGVCYSGVMLKVNSSDENEVASQTLEKAGNDDETGDTGEENEESTKPTSATNPDNPSDPDNSEDPDNPSDPDNSEDPDNPSDPDNPEDPDDSEDPDNPVDPDDPDDPHNPEEPAGPEYEWIIGMTFFDPSDSAQEDDSEVVWNSGYTSSELKAMREEKKQEISELKFEIKMAKAELEIMKDEADNGEVVAQFDGKVISVMEPENALAQSIPMIKVAGGGGFYVEGAVSELDLATIQVGQIVTVTSWDTYQTYQGTVMEIGSYPAENENYFYSGSSNVSYYPYKVFIDETADLQEGYYVSMVYQSEPQEEDGGIMYLENAFLREENGQHYVFVRNDEGLLEKRVVQVGDSSDGYMTVIESGLSETDYIAFPYGKDVVEGAPTVEGTWDNLYGY